MESTEKHLETLTEIRSLMEKSSRFISLSGLSGVSAGLAALLGSAAIFVYLDLIPFESQKYYYVETLKSSKWDISYYRFFFWDALIVLICALTGGVFFTTRKAKRKGQKIWDRLTQRLLINLMIPLITGGVFCIALLKYKMLGLVAPSTLIFYGLGLVNGSKYTLSDIRYLGFCEIILGIIGLFFPGYGLELWAFGFGILHIVYGILMYYKYER